MAIQGKRFKGTATISTLQPELVLVTGRVAIGGTGAVGTRTGRGFTVTRTGAGAYTIQITSQGGVPAILYATASVGNDSASVQHDAFVRAVPTTGAITVMTSAADTPETPADPVSGSFLQFLAIVQNAQITG